MMHPGPEGTAPPQSAPRRVVRSRRPLLLALALCIVACLPFVLVFTRMGNRAPEPLVLTDADQRSLTDGLRMVSPSFSGRTEDDEPYTVTADWALPDGPRPTRITLYRITATIVTSDGRETVMTAERGVFFPERERLRLTEGVSARTSDGYVMKTPNVDIDLDTRSLATAEPLEATGPRGSIRADTVLASEAEGRTVLFRGNVRVVFTPETVSVPTVEDVEPPDTGSSP